MINLIMITIMMIILTLKMILKWSQKFFKPTLLIKIKYTKLNKTNYSQLIKLFIYILV